MRNLLAFLAAAIVTFAGVGWYLDWYRIKSAPATDGHHQLNIDVNRKKMLEDVHKGMQKGEETLQDIIEKNNGSAPATKPAAKTPN
jgi:hypothetical protein